MIEQDETCSKRGKPIELYQHFMGGATNYNASFDYECEHCGTTLAIQVESDPRLDISIKEEDDDVR